MTSAYKKHLVDRFLEKRFLGCADRLIRPFGDVPCGTFYIFSKEGWDELFFATQNEIDKMSWAFPVDSKYGFYSLQFFKPIMGSQFVYGLNLK